MRIIPYTDTYKEAFIEFNTDWILDNFGFLEKEDTETFRHIDQELAAGAMIYIAVNEEQKALACCMARPLSGGRWELCKLASNKHLPHKGAGSAVFDATMRYAISQGASELFLLSNSKLKTALHIYEKFGFHEVRLEDYAYERGDIAFKKSII